MSTTDRSRPADEPLDLMRPAADLGPLPLDALARRTAQAWAYSAVTQPVPLAPQVTADEFSTVAVQMTQVSPSGSGREPSADLM